MKKLIVICLVVAFILRKPLFNVRFKWIVSTVFKDANLAIVPTDDGEITALINPPPGSTTINCNGFNLLHAPDNKLQEPRMLKSTCVVGFEKYSIVYSRMDLLIESLKSILTDFSEYEKRGISQEQFNEVFHQFKEMNDQDIIRFVLETTPDKISLFNEVGKNIISIIALSAKPMLLSKNITAINYSRYKDNLIFKFIGNDRNSLSVVFKNKFLTFSSNAPIKILESYVASSISTEIK